MKLLLEEEKLENTIKKIPQDSFTVLDFTEAVKKAYP
jgi:hypothetical protein